MKLSHLNSNESNEFYTCKSKKIDYKNAAKYIKFITGKRAISGSINFLYSLYHVDLDQDKMWNLGRKASIMNTCTDWNHSKPNLQPWQTIPCWKSKSMTHFRNMQRHVAFANQLSKLTYIQVRMGFLTRNISKNLGSFFDWNTGEKVD